MDGVCEGNVYAIKNSEERMKYLNTYSMTENINAVYHNEIDSKPLPDYREEDHHRILHCARQDNKELKMMMGCPVWSTIEDHPPKGRTYDDYADQRELANDY